MNAKGMDAREAELMNRYIYQVVRRLPKDQRDEVALELQELIGDMLEGAESIEEVLAKLGSPAVFARKYQDQTHYLIGPEYYENYIWLLRLVLICMLIPVFTVSLINGIREGTIFFGVSSLFIAGVTVFGGITLLFAVMERNQIKFDLKREKAWTVSDLGDHFAGKKNWNLRGLAPVPHKKAMISRGDSVVGIVFIVIFSMLLIFAPQLFGAIIVDGDVVETIPVFNLEQWHLILPIFVISLMIGLADEVFRLIIGHYCTPVMICNLVTGALQMVLAVILLKVLPFWNPEFGAEVQRQFGGQLEGIADVAEEFILAWDVNLLSHILLGICIFATVLEVGTTVYKTLRYGTETRI